MKACLVIPFYNHAGAIAATLDAVRRHGLPCYLVDDGSDADCTPLLARLAEDDRTWLTLLQLTPIQGMGAAVMAAVQAAADAGYTHALQLDADGQHDASDIPKLLSAAAETPGA